MHPLVCLGWCLILDLVLLDSWAIWGAWQVAGVSLWYRSLYSMTGRIHCLGYIWMKPVNIVWNQLACLELWMWCNKTTTTKITQKLMYTSWFQAIFVIDLWLKLFPFHRTTALGSVPKLRTQAKCGRGISLVEWTKEYNDRHSVLVWKSVVFAWWWLGNCLKAVL